MIMLDNLFIVKQFICTIFLCTDFVMQTSWNVLGKTSMSFCVDAMFTYTALAVYSILVLKPTSLVSFGASLRVIIFKKGSSVVIRVVKQFATTF